MSSQGNIEDRLVTLEREVANLKEQIGRRARKGHKDWPECLFGNMSEFPEWDEISRLGKEIGNAQGDGYREYE